MLIALRYAMIFFCHAVTLYLMHKPKYGATRSMAALGGLFLLLSAMGFALVLSGLQAAMEIAFFASLIAYCAVYLLIADGSFYRNLFVFASYANFFILTALFSQFIVDACFASSYLATLLMRLAFYVAFIPLLLLYLRPAFRRAAPLVGRGWGALALLALSFMFGVPVTVFVTSASFQSSLTDLIISCVLAAMMFTAYAVTYKMILYMRAENDRARLQAQQRLLQKELDEERGYVEKAKKYRHDIRHHNALLLEYLRGGDIDGARAYLAEYDATLERSDRQEFCKNTVANALLRITARRCQGAGVTLTTAAEIPEALPLSATETGTLLGNLLENACEACEKCPHAFLDLQAATRNGSLYIEVHNSVCGRLTFADDLPRTTKPHGGLGLSSMQSILSQHGGMLLCRQEESVFITQLILPL